MKEKMSFNATTVWILFILALLVGFLIGYIVGINMDNAVITGQAVAGDESSKELIDSFKGDCLNEDLPEEVCLRLVDKIQMRLNN